VLARSGIADASASQDHSVAVLDFLVDVIQREWVG
jgi:hypothetical protein